MINIMDSSAIVLLSSNTLLMVLTCAVVAVLVFFVEYTGTGAASKSSDKKSAKSSGDLQRPPGPKPFPIIGNLACLDGYEVPYQAFDDLAKKYGPIISLRLGSVPTVVVNGIDNIKEVLIAKSSHFDSRPNFRRYHDLFSGNKQNCKWTEFFFRFAWSFFNFSFDLTFNGLIEEILTKILY